MYYYQLAVLILGQIHRMPLLRQFLFVYLRYEFAALEPGTASLKQTRTGDQDAARQININTQHSRICWLATTGTCTAKSYYAMPRAEPERRAAARHMAPPPLSSSLLSIRTD